MVFAVSVRPVRWLAPLALIAVAIFVPTSALAAYPGQNGKIFFSACEEVCHGFNIYSVSPDGSELLNVTGTLTAGAGAPDDAFAPSVSADGKRMVFGVDSQATAEIWAIDTDGSAPLQLTKDELLDQNPAISPDGSKVVWQQRSPYPTYLTRDVWIMNVNGSSPEPLYEGGGEDNYPQFTPDGQTVVLSSQNGGYDIVKVPATPAEPPLTTATAIAEDHSLNEFDPSISPDGARVAFAEGPGTLPPFDVASVGIAGGPTTPLYNAAVPNESSPAYSPDGTKLAYLSDGVPMIGSADGGGTPVPLDVGSLVSIGGLEWAPALPSTSPPPGSSGGGGGAADTTPPQTTIDKGPKRRSKSHRAVFHFSSNEAGSSFECKLDRRKLGLCASPKKYGGLKAGRHTFTVFATDAAGNVDQSPAKLAFKLIAVK